MHCCIGAPRLCSFVVVSGLCTLVHSYAQLCTNEHVCAQQHNCRCCHPWFARCRSDSNCRGGEMDDYRPFGPAKKEAAAVTTVAARTARAVGSGSPPHTTLVSANCHICKLKENAQPNFKCATCQRSYHFTCLQVYGELPIDSAWRSPVRVANTPV
jgi:hypothetical protein